MFDFLAKRRGRLRIDKDSAHFAKLDRGDERILITFDMFTKGNTFDRQSGSVRQIAVTVDGATRLVTSGDYVNRETYDALVNFEAILPIDNVPKKPSPSTPTLVEKEDMVNDQAI